MFRTGGAKITRKSARHVTPRRSCATKSTRRCPSPPLKASGSTLKRDRHISASHTRRASSIPRCAGCSAGFAPKATRCSSSPSSLPLLPLSLPPSPPSSLLPPRPFPLPAFSPHLSSLPPFLLSSPAPLRPLNMFPLDAVGKAPPDLHRIGASLAGHGLQRVRGRFLQGR